MSLFDFLSREILPGGAPGFPAGSPPTMSAGVERGAKKKKEWKWLRGEQRWVKGEGKGQQWSLFILSVTNNNTTYNSYIEREGVCRFMCLSAHLLCVLGASMQCAVDFVLGSPQLEENIWEK